MRWLGTMLHLMYPPSSSATTQALAAIVDQRRTHIDAMEQSRRRLEEIAADPLDDTLNSIIKDL